jgi:hypothetical protein
VHDVLKGWRYRLEGGRGEIGGAPVPVSLPAPVAAEPA